MKTAVSLPDGLFEKAEKTALKLGIPRSQFYAKALEEFIEVHSKESVKERLNHVYSESKNNSDISADLVSAEILRKELKNDTW
jgi:hypothetical protein